MAVTRDETCADLVEAASILRAISARMSYSGSLAEAIAKYEVNSAACLFDMQAQQAVRTTAPRKSASWIRKPDEVLADLAKVPSVLPPHEQRVMDEHSEISDRLYKLAAFLDSGKAHAIETEQFVLMIQQRQIMDRYRHILQARIAHFKSKESKTDS